MASPIAFINKQIANTTDWFVERWQALDLFDETFAEKAKTNPFYTLGGSFYFMWMLVIISGLWLMVYYIPTKDQAFESIYNIEHHTFGGWLMRGIHKYGCDAMIILATTRVYRMVFTGEYKRPHELTYVCAVLSIILCMYSGLTGYLLIWNQRAFWATKVFATFPTYTDQVPDWIPGGTFNNNLYLGRTIYQILLGGTSIGQATITRFYSFHFAFSAIILALVELRFWKTRNNWSISRRMNMSGKHMLIMFLTLCFISAILPAEQGRPANAEQTPNPILSDWYFLALYQMLKYQQPFIATVATLLTPVLAIIFPFVDRRKEKGILQRPLVLLVATYAFLVFIAFSVLIILNIADIHRDPPYWYISMGLVLLAGILWDAWYIKKRDGLTCLLPKLHVFGLTLWVLGGLWVYWVFYTTWTPPYIPEVAKKVNAVLVNMTGLGGS